MTTYTCTRTTHWLLLGLVYLASFWPALLNNGISWDDCCLHLTPLPAVVEMYAQVTGGNFSVAIWGILAAAVDPAHHFIHLVSLLLFFILSLGLYTFLSKLPHINRDEAFIASMASLAAPLYMARHFTIMFPALILLVVAGGGMFLLLRDVRANSLTARLLALCCFGYASQYQSFSPLIFALVFVLACAYDTKLPPVPIFKTRLSFASVISFSRSFFIKYWPYYVIPIAAYIVTRFIFTPHTLYGVYNNLYIHSFSDYAQSTASQLFFWISSIVKSYELSPRWFIRISILMFIIFSLILRKLNLNNLTNANRSKYLLPATAFLCFASTFAYIALSRNLNHAPAATRDSILLLLPFGLCICSLVCHILKPDFVKITLSAILSLFVAANMILYIDMLRYSVAQDILVYQLKKTPEINDCSTVIMDNKFKELSIWGNSLSFRFYEFNQLFSKAYPGDTFYVETAGTVGNKKELEQFKPYDVYHMSAWDADGKECKLTVSPVKAQNALPHGAAITMAFLRYFAPERYAERLKNVIDLKISDN